MDNYTNEARNIRNYEALKALQKGVAYKTITEKTGLSRDQINNIRRVYKETNSLKRVMEISSSPGPKQRRKLEDYKNTLKDLREMNLSTPEITDALKTLHNVNTNPMTVIRYLKDMGYEAMGPRSDKVKTKAKRDLHKYIALKTGLKSENDDKITSGDMGGLFLFMKYIQDRKLNEITTGLTDREGKISNFKSILTMLGMKLLGINTLDGVEILKNKSSFKYFCGLDKLPSAAYLQKFVNRLKIDRLQALQVKELQYLTSRDLVSLDNLNIDYSTSPYTGKHRQDRNYYPKDGYSVPSLLRCLVQDQDSKFLVHFKGDVAKTDKPHVVDDMFSLWQKKGIRLPHLLVMDNKFLTYKKMNELKDIFKIDFLTRRRKGSKMVEKARQIDQKMRNNYRIPRRFSRYKKFTAAHTEIELRALGKVKQVILYDQGEPYKFLIITKDDISERESVLIYDERWGVEHNINANVTHFELHSPKNNNPARIELDSTLNMIAYNLYNEFQLNLPEKLRYNPKKACQRYIELSSYIDSDRDNFEVNISSDTKYAGFLRAIPHFEKSCQIKWLNNKSVNFNIAP